MVCVNLVTSSSSQLRDLSSSSCELLPAKPEKQLACGHLCGSDSRNCTCSRKKKMSADKRGGGNPAHNKIQYNVILSVPRSQELTHCISCLQHQLHLPLLLLGFAPRIFWYLTKLSSVAFEKRPMFTGARLESREMDAA